MKAQIKVGVVMVIYPASRNIRTSNPDLFMGGLE